MLSISDHRLISGHFFFVDIVGLSKPNISTKTQVKKIEMLHKMIKECDAFSSTSNEGCIKVATGDGMVMAFLFDQQLPIELAKQLHQKIALYNKGKIPTEIVEVRIGLHSGNSYLVNDINDNLALWGSGVILARRVMDLGDAGHILLTERIAKDLMEISDEYQNEIHEIQDFVIKHDKSIPVFSAFANGFGNPSVPQAGIMQGIRKEIAKINRYTLYPSAGVTIKLEDIDTMLVKHKRTYEIINTSEKPIKSIIHGIGTDLKKTFSELKIHVYDENHIQMKINKITMDYPFQKEFSTLFNKPIMHKEKGRSYTLEYEVEEPERYFENTFMIPCDKFQLTFEFPSTLNLKTPILYEKKQETEEKTESKVLPTIKTKGNTTSVSWELVDSSRGKTIRIDW